MFFSLACEVFFADNACVLSLRPTSSALKMDYLQFLEASLKFFLRLSGFSGRLLKSFRLWHEIVRIERRAASFDVAFIVNSVPSTNNINIIPNHAREK